MYNVRAIQLSLLVACMYTAVGLLNLGFLTNFLSHSVINGFTSGAAISAMRDMCPWGLGLLTAVKRTPAMSLPSDGCVLADTCPWEAPKQTHARPLLALTTATPPPCLPAPHSHLAVPGVCFDGQQCMHAPAAPLTMPLRAAARALHNTWAYTCMCVCRVSRVQLKYLLGFNVPRSDRLHELLRLYIEGMHGFVWQECVMGVTSLT
jgi:hypothetical protein